MVTILLGGIPDYLLYLPKKEKPPKKKKVKKKEKPL